MLCMQNLSYVRINTIIDCMQLFFELLQVALGARLCLSNVPTEEEWSEAYDMASKQAVVGMMISGIEKLPSEQKPSQEILLQWIGEVMQIERQNKQLDYAAEHLTRIFKTGGFRSCVLKGQGIARLYPQPERRQSGDIDLWVEGGRDKVLKYLKQNLLGTGQVVIHHVDAYIIEGVQSEIHFKPVFACNPILHHRLQKFFKKNADSQFSNYDEKLGFSYPTLRFNAVYILAHIYMHFLYEGIGLRQIVDYYYVLKNLDDEGKRQAASDIKKVGLLKFAGAVMFVLQKVCGMDDNSMVTKPDDKRGTLLLDEIMVGGNFGKYDDRLKSRDEKNLVLFNLVSLRRQLRFLRYYPMDIISIPFFKVWHWCWRKCKGYL